MLEQNILDDLLNLRTVHIKAIGSLKTKLLINAAMRLLGADFYLSLPFQANEAFAQVLGTTWKEDTGLMEFNSEFASKIAKAREFEFWTQESNVKQLYFGVIQKNRERSDSMKLIKNSIDPRESRSLTALMKQVGQIVLNEDKRGIIKFDNLEMINLVRTLKGKYESHLKKKPASKEDKIEQTEPKARQKQSRGAPCIKCGERVSGLFVYHNRQFPGESTSAQSAKSTVISNTVVQQEELAKSNPQKNQPVQTTMEETNQARKRKSTI